MKWWKAHRASHYRRIVEAAVARGMLSPTEARTLLLMREDGPMQNYEDKTYWRGWRHGAAVACVITSMVWWLEPLRWFT